MMSNALLRQFALRVVPQHQASTSINRTTCMLRRSVSSLAWTTRTSGFRSFSSSPEIRSVAIEDQFSEKEARFADMDLHPKSLKALRRHGLHNATEIQRKTYSLVVSGRDVVARARTGTGKTLAFLLPALERILKQKEQPKPGIQILVLSPTRELAAQIGKEAEQLVESHDKNITVQIVYGGSSKRKDIERFNHQFPSILVATPGRLKDHLASTNGFIDAVKNLKILVLDETDRLLDMGFRRDIQDILSCLPTSRQTLLFSATLPLNVQGVVKLANKPDYKLVDCIQDEDPATQTNVQTEQSHIVLPTHRFWTGSMEVLLDLMDGGQSKIMVFFPMTSLVELYANLFNLRFGRRVWELHGKMHQKERSVTSRRFRNASSGVLFTSDVSARGVDYPNVTHVVQIGASDSRETYIHRLGRTGRAGKHGKGLLILPQLEQDFLQDLEGLDISEDKDLQYRLSIGASKELLDELGPVAQDVRAGRDKRVEKSVQNAYQAMVSYYFHRTEDDMEGEYVSTVNRLVQDMGLTELPAIDLNRARKIGIDDTPGLNIQQSWRDQSWTGSWGQGPVDTDRKEFGKPHGDFGGKFDTPEVKGTQFDRRNRWNQSDESNSSNDDRAGRRGWARPVSSRNPGRTQGFRRERHEHSVEKHSGGRRVKNQKSEKKSKAGYAKDPFGDFGKSFSKKKASSFQRWESHGSLSWP